MLYHGTVIGGLCAYLFLRYRIHKNKQELLEGVTSTTEVSVSTKDIIKKIASRAIPVILIAATQNIYSMVDLRLIITGLHSIGFDADTSQLIGSICVTWAPKICMIINSIAVSMCLSIIPYIVNSFVKNEHEELNRKFNQAVNTILYVSIPLATFLCIFRNDIYNIFYGTSTYGGNILAVDAVLSIFFCVQMIMDMILQGMKNYKIVFINTLVGLFLNAALDIPIILLLNKWGLHPYVGSLVASIIGLSVSIAIIMISVQREYKFNYKPILKNLTIIILASFMMGLVAFIIQSFVTISPSRIMKTAECGIIGLVVSGIYLAVTYFSGTMKEILGEDFLKNLINKFKKAN